MVANRLKRRSWRLSPLPIRSWALRKRSHERDRAWRAVGFREKFAEAPSGTAFEIATDLRAAIVHGARERPAGGVNRQRGAPAEPVRAVKAHEGVVAGPRDEALRVVAQPRVVGPRYACMMHRFREATRRAPRAISGWFIRAAHRKQQPL